MEEKTDEEKEVIRERARKKAQEKREKVRLENLAKQTLSYQKLVNQNRNNFGLKKNKLQMKMNSFFQVKESNKGTLDAAETN